MGNLKRALLRVVRRWCSEPCFKPFWTGIASSPPGLPASQQLLQLQAPSYPPASRPQGQSEGTQGLAGIALPDHVQDKRNAEGLRIGWEAHEPADGVSGVKLSKLREFRRCE